MAAVGDVDVEVLLIAWLGARLPGVTLVAELDNDLLADLPLVQVTDVPGGGDDGFRIDRPVVDINAYAASRGEARALGQRVRALLLTELRGSVTGGGVITRVNTIQGPTVRPYTNTELRRVGATYQVFLHPVS